MTTVVADMLYEDFVSEDTLLVVEDADIVGAMGIDVLVGIAIAIVDCVVPACRAPAIAAVEMDLVVEIGPATGGMFQELDSGEKIESEAVVNMIVQTEIQWVVLV